MKRLLIISEDVVKIQTLSGFLGRNFARIYIAWICGYLKIIRFILSPFYQISILVTNNIGIKGKGVIYYGDELSRVDYAADRKKYIAVCQRLAKALPKTYTGIALPRIFLTKLSLYLAYHYFIYEKVYTGLFHSLRPDRVVVVGNSYLAMTARFLTKNKSLSVNQITLFDLSWIFKRLQNFLLNREYKRKAVNFNNLTGTFKPNFGKNPVLLSVDFPRHLKTLIPIYNRLKAIGENPVLVTDIANLQSTLNNLHAGTIKPILIPAILARHELPPLIKIDFGRLLKGLKISTLDDWFYYLGLITVQPMINWLMWLSEGYLIAAKKLMQVTKPKGVIVVSDLRLAELALAAQAKNYHVPTLLVSPNMMLDLTELNPYRSADKVAVVGHYIKRQLEKIGVPSSKIYLTGDVIGENLIGRQRSANQQQVFRALGISEEKKIGLLISFRPTWMIPKEEKQAFIQMAVRAASKIPNLVLVVKPHPSEKRYRLLEELREWGLNNLIVSDNNQLSLLDLIRASSVVLQTWSFTLFEAVMLNRPVIAINPFNKNYNYFLQVIKPGGAVEVNNLSSLKRWVRIFLDKQHPQAKAQLARARRACADFIQYSKGETSGKIIDLLLG